MIPTNVERKILWSVDKYEIRNVNDDLEQSGVAADAIFRAHRAIEDQIAEHKGLRQQRERSWVRQTFQGFKVRPRGSQPRGVRDLFAGGTAQFGTGWSNGKLCHVHYLLRSKYFDLQMNMRRELEANIDLLSH